MFAFAVTWRVVVGGLDQLLAMAPALAQNLQQQHGFQFISLYVNRAENTLLIISHWASLEDLEADKEANHAQTLKDLAAVVTEIQSEIYETVTV